MCMQLFLLKTLWDWYFIIPVPQLWKPNLRSYFFRITELKGIRLRIQTKDTLGPEYMILFISLDCFQKNLHYHYWQNK